MQNYFFSLLLKFPNNGIRALKDLEGPVRENRFLLSMASTLSPPVFGGKNYQVWAVKMKAHLKGLGLWQWVESEREEKKSTVVEASMEKKTQGWEEAAQGRQHCPQRQQQEVHDYFAGDPNCYTFGVSWRTGINHCFRGNQGCDKLVLDVIEEETLF